MFLHWLNIISQQSFYFFFPEQELWFPFPSHSQFHEKYFHNVPTNNWLNQQQEQDFLFIIFFPDIQWLCRHKVLYLPLKWHYSWVSASASNLSTQDFYHFIFVFKWLLYYSLFWGHFSYQQGKISIDICHELLKRQQECSVNVDNSFRFPSCQPQSSCWHYNTNSNINIKYWKYHMDVVCEYLLRMLKRCFAHNKYL